MKVSYKIEEDPQVLLAVLEYEYCLPKAFWTNREWNMICYYTIWYKALMLEYKKYRELCKMHKELEEFSYKFDKRFGGSISKVWNELIKKEV